MRNFRALQILFWSCVLVIGAGAAPQIYRGHVDPHWFDSDSKFWYRNDLHDGEREFILVDAAQGARRTAFDHAKVAKALSSLEGREFSAAKLPVEDLAFSRNGKSISLRGNGKSWELNLESYAIEVSGGTNADATALRADPFLSRSRTEGPETELQFVNRLEVEVELFWLDTDGMRQPYGTLKPGEERQQHTFAGHVWLARALDGRLAGPFQAIERPGRVVIDRLRNADDRSGANSRQRREPRARPAASPDGKWEAFARDHNIWVRERASGKEFALSSAAGETNTFHLDVSRARLINMEYDRPDAPPEATEVFWSPDSTRLVALQTLTVPERRVYLVESSPRDQLQPKLQSYPYLKAGDTIPIQTPRLFELGSRREIAITNALFPNPWSVDGFRWAADSSRFTFVYNQRGHQVLRVIAVDAGTGEAKAIVDEHADTFIDYSQKFYCEWLGDNELVWMSERDGWNHLYLYDAKSGTLKRQITKGNWAVRNVVQVDRERREILFRACGLRTGEDPYYFNFARVGLDGGEVTVLTQGDGTHSVAWSPGRKFLLDTWSRVDLPPVTVLRRGNDGKLVCPLEEADAAEVLAARGCFPERFVAKGRDSLTDIYGIIHRPRDFDPHRKYPVLENIYAGPHDFFVPKPFAAVYRHQQQLADRGMIVVQIDGMGTNWRERKFHDMAWKNLHDAGYPDRIAWMQAAAAKFPELDISRVGVYGGSAGGQNAFAAMLWHGDFYKACVADCGCHDNRMDKIWWSEAWMGWPVGPQYEENSNVVNAHRLQGKAMLMVGELDRNVDPSSTFQVANALVRAGKDFELVVVPGAGHGSAETPYGSRKRADFLVRNLIDKN